VSVVEKSAGKSRAAHCVPRKVKLGNVTVTSPDYLEVGVAVGTFVRVYRSSTGGLLSTLAAPPNGQVFTTLSMGDVDGDGDDDFIASTTGSGNTPANVMYYRNNPGGWAAILIDASITGKIWDGDMGDMSKSQYPSR